MKHNFQSPNVYEDQLFVDTTGLYKREITNNLTWVYNHTVVWNEFSPTDILQYVRDIVETVLWFYKVYNVQYTHFWNHGSLIYAFND